MLKYPDSPRTDTVDALHGVEVPDPYRWLEDLDSEQTRAWIEAQNALTFDYLGQIPAREQIRERITTLWNYEKFGLPLKRSHLIICSYQNMSGMGLTPAIFVNMGIIIILYRLVRNAFS